MLKSPLAPTLRSLGLGAAAVVVTACRPSVPAPTPGEHATPAAVTVRELLRHPQQWNGSRVAVSGYVVASVGACLDVLCKTASGCCGSCTGEARLAARRRTSNPEHLIGIAAAPGSGFPDGFGTCHDSDQCELSCEPAAEQRVRLTATVRVRHNEVVLEVTDVAAS